MADSTNTILHPRPQRPFRGDRESSGSSSRSGLGTPSKESLDMTKLTAERDERGGLLNRTVSALNLTSSTLFGIYAADEPVTPSGLGTQTPAPRASIDDSRPPIIGAYEPASSDSTRPLDTTAKHTSQLKYFLRLIIQTALLFIAGVAYGVIISELHDSQKVAPVQIEILEHWSWGYLLGWGGAGVFLGALLPWVDMLWEEVLGDSKDLFPTHQRTPSGSNTSSAEDGRPGSSSGERSEEIWTPAVRSVTAFIGVAFAIRRLPWQSTLQVSLTLALVNPVLWYLFDRSKPGFLLAAIVGIAGTIIALGVNPEIVPSPATPSPQAHLTSTSFDEYYAFDGNISVERIGVGTWIASVLFCSSLCFGNLGRRLALGPTSKA